MTKEAFEKLLKQNEIYLKSSKTKTSDSQVLEIYAYIIQHENYKVNERIRLYLELLDIQRTDYDLYDTFHSANIDLKLAEKELLIRLAEKLKFRSVGELLNSI